MNEPIKIINDSRPDIIQRLGNNNYYYNYNITEGEQVVNNIQTNEQTTKTIYSSIQVKLSGIPNYKECIKAIIRQYLTEEEELDLINSSNATTNGIANSTSDIQKYNNYLQLLDTIKSNVKTDFEIEQTLESAKYIKLNQIADVDNKSNEFFIIVNGDTDNKYSLWMDSETRNNLLNVTLPALLKNGKTTTQLWTSSLPHISIEVPIQWATDNIPSIEVYAKQTYDIRQKNENLVYYAKTIEEINSIDITKDYPSKLELILNI